MAESRDAAQAPPLTTRRRRIGTGWRLLLGAVVLVAAAVVVLVLVNRSAKRSAPSTSGPSAGQPRAAQPSSALAQWRLSLGLPAGWTLEDLPGTRAQRTASGLAVTTSRGTYEYQLLSPQATLVPGAYLATVRGSVLAGGLELGILNARRDRWLSTTLLSGATHGQGGSITAPFILLHRTPVRIVLANSRADVGSSRWRISEVSIRDQAPQDAAMLRRGTAISSFDFSGGLPGDWSLERLPGIAIHPTSTGLAVITSQGTSQYQLLSGAYLLAAGHHGVLLDGQVISGGLEIGILDTKADRWIRTASFPASRKPVTAPYTVQFTLARAKPIQIILANSRFSPGTSSWLIRNISTW